MEIQANPSLEDLQTLLLIAGVAMTVMLMIIGSFVGMHFRAINSLTKTVGNLDKTMTSFETQLKIQSPVTEKRLNDHAADLKGLDKRLVVIETDHKNFHKKRTNGND